MHNPAYLEIKGLSRSAELGRVTAYPIPCGSRENNVFATRQGLLLGDAAGLTDPLTGEGIFYALKEALHASNIIQEALGSGYECLETYNAILKRELIADLIRARRLSCLLYQWPGFSYKVLRCHGAALGELLLKITTGEKTYSELHRKLFKF